MSEGFVDLRQNQGQLVDESFWPSFTDIMTVVVMIFLLATSILIVKNWELVEELKSSIVVEKKISQRLKASMAAQQKTSQELLISQDKRQKISRKLQLSMEAEHRTAEAIREASKENATLEETLTHTQSEMSLLRLQLMQARESATERDSLIVEQDKQLSAMKQEQRQLNQTIASREIDLTRSKDLVTRTQAQVNRTQEKMNHVKQQLAQANTAMSSLQGKLEVNTVALAKREIELEDQLATLLKREQELDTLSQKNQNYQDNISNYERQITAVQQQHSVLAGEYEDLEDKYNKLIRPSRSAIGKFVVEVRYEKLDGTGLIQFRQSDKGPYKTLSEEKLHHKLASLKEQYKDTLYVKIIIPDNSGLSYSEAWAFMIGILEKYDYYYQDDE